jgi:hypothetical protein
VRWITIASVQRRNIMRKLIVNNFVTVDGYYEAKDKTIDRLFEYYHDDYADDQNFDYYAAERLRAADTLILLTTALIAKVYSRTNAYMR